MAEYKHFEFEGLMAIAGFVSGLIGCSLGVSSAMARFVCGLRGCGFNLGLVPTLAIPTFVLGAVGATCGFIGRKRSLLGDSESLLAHWALWAVILGCVAMSLAGFVIVAS